MLTAYYLPCQVECLSVLAGMWPPHPLKLLLTLGPILVQRWPALLTTSHAAD